MGIEAGRTKNEGIGIVSVLLLIELQVIIYEALEKGGYFYYVSCESFLDASIKHFIHLQLIILRCKENEIKLDLRQIFSMETEEQLLMQRKKW